eukprot:1485975-Heterocapsa_arctica.AAC.1
MEVPGLLIEVNTSLRRSQVCGSSWRCAAAPASVSDAMPGAWRCAEAALGKVLAGAACGVRRDAMPGEANLTPTHESAKQANASKRPSSPRERE